MVEPFRDGISVIAEIPLAQSGRGLFFATVQFQANPDVLKPSDFGVRPVIPDLSVNIPSQMHRQLFCISRLLLLGT